MGLTVSMCHDIEKYEESEVGGFGIRKFFYIVLGVAAGAATMAFLYFVLHVHILVAVYLMVPVVVLVISKGFYGKGRVSLVKGILMMFHKPKPLTYQSTETSSVRVSTDKKEGMDGKEKETKRRFPMRKAGG